MNTNHTSTTLHVTYIPCWRHWNHAIHYEDKDFIKILRKEKHYSSRKFIRELPNENQSRCDLDHLIKLKMLLPDIRSVFGNYYVFQQGGAPTHRARDTVTMLQRETPEFIPPQTRPPNSPNFNPVDYSIWSILQERVYNSQIHDVKELNCWKNVCWGMEATAWTTPS